MIVLINDGPANLQRGLRRLKAFELIKQFKPEPQHGQWDLGEPVGKEVW